MSTQSFPFDFQRTPNFFMGFNNNFHLTDMNGTANNYELVFASYSPNNIENCLNGSILDTANVTVVATADMKLKYGDETIISVGDTIWNIGNANYTLQAVFLRDKATGFVMGYSIHENPFNVTNQVIVRDNTVLWSFIDGN